MAGIYIHIPFCKSRCHYCNFFSVVTMHKMPEVMEAIGRELVQKRDDLKGEAIDSIYIGGGTPSLLESDQLAQLLDNIHHHYTVVGKAEITFEVNPDDLTAEKVAAIRHAGVNRISVGVQSFSDQDLQYLGRRHNGAKAHEALKLLTEADFISISADLIYGIPGQSEEVIQTNLEQLVGYGIPHISCYSLTVERETHLEEMIRQGNRKSTCEEDFLVHFSLISRMLQERGYLHYEISNFAQEGHLALHNTNYWMQQPYIGVGPSAHGYHGNTRVWNPSSIQQYLSQDHSGRITGESEILGEREHYNEYIMTRLRTMWGIGMQAFSDRFGSDQLKRLLNDAEPFIALGQLVIHGDKIIMTAEGLPISDHIVSSLFF